MAHAPQSPEGLRCTNCPEGTYEESETTETIERNETVVVVREIPAHVCDTCGDVLLGRAEIGRLHSIVDSAEELGVDSIVCRYGEDEISIGASERSI